MVRKVTFVKHSLKHEFDEVNQLMINHFDSSASGQARDIGWFRRWVATTVLNVAVRLSKLILARSGSPHLTHISGIEQVSLLLITKTRPCNIQRYFTAVKTLIFR